MTDWDEAKLHVVTGKGGTGKSTVAAALALALASAPARTSSSARSRAARASPGCSTSTRSPTRSAGSPPASPIPGWPTVAGQRLRAAHRRRVRAAGVPRDVLPPRPRRQAPGPLRRHRVRDHRSRRACATCCSPARSTRPPAATASRASATAVRRDRARRPADRAGSASSSTSTASWPDWPRWARSRRQADNIMTLFRSPRTAVHLVTVLEEMPVQETADGIAQLREHGLPVGGVVVNLVRPQDLAGGDLTAARRGALDPEEVAADLRGAGIEVDDALVPALLAEARDHAERRSARGRAAQAGRRPRRPDVRAAPAADRRRPRRPLRARRRAQGPGHGVRTR